MKLSSAWRSAVALGILGIMSNNNVGVMMTDAFMPVRMLQTHKTIRCKLASSSSSTVRFMSNDESYNDDFINALKLPDELRPRSQDPKPAPVGGGEEGMGGTRFKAMMEAARAGGGALQQRRFTPKANPLAGMPPPTLPDDMQSQQQPPILQDPYYQQQQQQPPPPLQVPPPPMPSMDNMSVEEQAAMFRQMMQQQQQQAYPPPPPQRMGGGVDARGRKIGRNRDADSINNTSDLYFAQLKRDSTVRLSALYRGDDDKANAVFQDEGVKQLEELMYENPYLQKENRDKDFIDFSSDDEFLVNPSVVDGMYEKDAPKVRINYKEKLAQKRGGAKTAASPATTTTPESVAVTPVPETPVVPPVVVQPQEPPPPPMAAVPQSPVEPVAAATASSAAMTTAAVPNAQEDMRSDLRQLQGYLLKHRGGQGFGSGLLRGPEVQQFEHLLEKVSAGLQAEAAATTSSSAVATGAVAAAAPVAPAVPVAPATVTPPAAVAPTPVVTAATPGAAAVAVEGGGANDVGAALACVEGAAQMYKNSPAAMQAVLIPTLQAALNSATQTLTAASPNPLLPPVPVIPMDAATATAQVPASLATLEGAIQMYKNSPPALQPTMLPTLQVALLSAVNTMNQASGTVLPATPPPPPPVSTSPPPSPPSPPSPPVITTATAQAPAAVTPAPVEVPPVLEAPPPMAETTSSAAPTQAREEEASLLYSGRDRNSKRFQEVYQALEDAEGKGKMGLSQDLEPQQASDLIQELNDMRQLLVEELSSGIPDEIISDDGTKPNFIPVKRAEPLDGTAVGRELDAARGRGGNNNKSSTQSKYREMLARVKAAKKK